MRKDNARRASSIRFSSSPQPEPHRPPARSTPLSDADIMREAELILAAIRAGPRSGAEDILVPARELDSDDEERVVAALEEISRNDTL